MAYDAIEGNSVGGQDRRTVELKDNLLLRIPSDGFCRSDVASDLPPPFEVGHSSSTRLSG